VITCPCCPPAIKRSDGPHCVDPRRRKPTGTLHLRHRPNPAPPIGNRSRSDSNKPPNRGRPGLLGRLGVGVLATGELEQVPRRGAPGRPPETQCGHNSRPAKDGPVLDGACGATWVCPQSPADPSCTEPPSASPARPRRMARRRLPPGIRPRAVLGTSPSSGPYTLRITGSLGASHKL
jgi:hypothetical protein